MAKKISQLTQATEVKSDDVTVIVQDGETKKLPLNMMVTKQDIENKKIAGLAKLDEIEATYENDTYTPTITVKNKSSVKVGEGDEVDYSANVMDGHAKSAILKGQTLVNLSENLETITRSLNGSYINEKLMDNIEKLKCNTYYTILYRLENLSGNHEYYNGIGLGIGITSFSKDLPDTVRTIDKNGGWCKVRFQLTDDFIEQFPTYKQLYIRPIRRNTAPVEGESVDYTIRGFAILEGDYITNPIPFNEVFEGMQSVKMPVLTTTGKNLFNYMEFLDMTTNHDFMYGAYKCKSIKLKPNTDYTVSISESEHVGLLLINSVKTISNGTGYLNFNNKSSISKTMRTSDSGELYIGTTISDSELLARLLQRNIQIEQGSTATTYEPYKSNILTVNEPVELRGIGDVQDTLNCLTGEVVRRTECRLLENRYDIVKTDLTNTYRFEIVDILQDCDDTSIKRYSILNGFKYDYSADDTEHFYIVKNNLIVFVNKSNIPNGSIDEFKEFFYTNSRFIVYPLAQESVKTVDLMPSGTHPSTTPYCWKNGHIQLSSSGLLPNLEYSVVTSRAGQINQNATMIVKNDKRIFDLEILLAGGLVNTTYQALTLQNQVETGLSKVSLNSETEPDYLLYHMIMKLIEEKAYKLDDLTEKVSVFYLYEKLSDEQFETIYSALYPFVEDEIVEEPVVEELPEVVEDEVIM